MPKQSIHSMVQGLLACGAIWLLAGVAAAQTTPQTADGRYAMANARYSNAAPAQHAPLSPFNPVGFRHDTQPFAPADLSDYGNGLKPNIGYFFSYERLYWSLSKPSTADIGSSTAEGFFNEQGLSVFEQNSFDTDFLKSTATWGNRYEGGYMDTNDYGWLVSVIHHLSQNQQCVLPGAQVLFDDPSGFLLGFLDANFDDIDDDVNGNNVFGRDGEDLGTPNDNPPPEFIPPPDGIIDVDAPTDFDDLVTFLPTFRVLFASQHTELNSVELMRMYRAPRLHNGGVLELYYGVRWMKIDDRFNLFGQGGVLDEFMSETKVENSMVGPQIGVRYGHQRGRWTFSTEGRFTAAANFQSVHQKTLFATNAAVTGEDPMDGETMTPARNFPLNLRPLASKVTASDEEFAPIGEFRIQTSYQLTRSMGLKVGYTAMMVDGISRASNRIAYRLPEMGLLNSGTRQDMFINGLSLGFEINR